MAAEGGLVLSDASLPGRGPGVEPAGTPGGALIHDSLVRVLGRRGLVRSLLRDKTARVGLVVILVLVAVALLAPVLAPRDPLAFDTGRLEGPSREHPLGTDRLGRDLLSRLMYGARLSLETAGLASIIIMVLGVVVGGLAGYLGGFIDAVLMRVVDTILAFPSLILAIVIAGLFEPSLLTLMLALASVWWVGYARIIRGLILTVRERPYIEAARIGGARETRVFLRHVLPNILPPVIVLVTLEMGTIILAIAALNFLGLGAQPPTPEWGAMLNDGRNFFFTAPHVMLFPGLVISLAVLGFNLLGDGLRDVLDPKV